MIEENDKLKKLNSLTVKLHREISERRDGDLQSMIVFHDDLQDQLRVMNLKNELEREEFERCLQIANQHSVVSHS